MHNGSADPSLTARLEGLRVLSVGCVLALVVLCLAWELVLAPTGNKTLVLKALPLAAALFGLMRHRMYTYRWLSLLVWLYIAEGLVRGLTERGWVPWLAALEVALCVVVFFACVLHVRWRLAAATPATP
jgi:uncharacterized membrane protein